MCNDTNWIALLKYKAQSIVSSELVINILKKPFKNVIVNADSDFDILPKKYLVGGKYEIIVNKIVPTDLNIFLPSGSVISNSSDNFFTLSGSIDSKFLLEYTHDGNNFVWKQIVNLSGGPSLIGIKNIAVTPYTLLAEDSGKMLMANTDQIIIPSGLPIGFNVSICQVHPTQQILFTPEWGGITMNEPDAKNKTAKQHATVSIICVDYDVFQLSGYTG